MNTADLIIKNAHVIPMNGEAEKDASVVVKDGVIVCVAGEEEAARYTCGKVIDAAGKYLFPGLVSTHTHLFQTLLKGLCADYPLEEWVRRMINPVVSILRPDDLYWAAKLGCIEAIKCGTTTTLDFNYVTYNPEFSTAVIRAMQECGIRAVYGRGIHSGGIKNGVNPVLVESPDVFIKDTQTLAQSFGGSDMLSVWMAPSVIWGMDMAGLEAIRAYSRESGMSVTMHVLETRTDADYTLKEWGKRPLQLLDGLGYFENRFILVHGVQLDSEDLRLIEEKKIGWSHCMAANMYLGSGIAPVLDVSEGVPVSLGVDGAASNNSQDMVELLKLTALGHKGYRRNAGAVSAARVLRMATVGGAAALGMADKIGTIEPGKKADLMLFDANDAKAAPVYDPIAGLVYSSSHCNISTVIVDGKIRMEDRVLTDLDEAEAVAQVKARAVRIQSQLGLA